MDLGDFFGDMFNDEHWDNSDSTSGSNYRYYITSSTGEPLYENEPVNYSFSSYVPQNDIDIDKYLDHLGQKEKEAVAKENYEIAAKLRDKATLISTNSEMLKKLYDLKARAIKQNDYTFAQNIKDKIQELIKVKKVTDENKPNNSRKE